MSWTAYEVERLQELWGEGKTPIEIRRALSGIHSVREIKVKAELLGLIVEPPEPPPASAAPVPEATATEAPAADPAPVVVAAPAPETLPEAAQAAPDNTEDSGETQAPEATPIEAPPPADAAECQDGPTAGGDDVAPQSPIPLSAATHDPKRHEDRGTPQAPGVTGGERPAPPPRAPYRGRVVNPPGSDGWTQARLDELGVLCAAGESASAIARQLGGGLTRNAIIGKLHRMNMSHHDQSWGSREARPPSLKAPKAVRSRPFTIGKGSKPPRVAATPTRAAPKRVALVWSSAKPAEPTSLDLALLELKDNTCRWPHGNETPYRFCGQPTFKAFPYCEYHARVGLQSNAKGPDRAYQTAAVNLPPLDEAAA